MSEVIDLDDANFDSEVVDSPEPVLVEFWSEGSYASRELAGIVDGLADEFRGQVKVARLNMDAHWQTADEYGVKTAPAVLLFQNNRVVERITGSLDQTQYRQAIYEVISQYWVI